KNADWAKTGRVSQALLNELLEEPFFQQAPPKSTGRELFNLTWLDKILEKQTALSTQDVQRTLVELTVQSITAPLLAINNPQQLPCLLLVCGGGAKNPLIMQRLTELLAGWKLATTSDYGLDIDYVEAAAFAWLAYRRIHNLSSNLPNVTGAKSAVSLGVIYPKE
ncbi:MAG TPA: anhydro-N-acetylmuramic acid kinase, partial [Pasteurellaceae bacterium]|nr:anhydro-N-acetylmuramic acid kinase [Pasteurellaceae bacterium]